MGAAAAATFDFWRIIDLKYPRATKPFILYGNGIIIKTQVQVNCYTNESNFEIYELA